MKIVRGRVLAKFGDDISTDDMTSSKYVASDSPGELAKICMRDIDPDFPAKMAPGGFVVGGRNFGCGSSREWSPVAMKAAGTQAILAEQMARIFYRNCINIGLPAIECDKITSSVEVGDEIEIDLAAGTVRNITRGTVQKGIPIPEFLLEIVQSGGLVEMLRCGGNAGKAG